MNSNSDRTFDKSAQLLLEVHIVSYLRKDLAYSKIDFLRFLDLPSASFHDSRSKIRSIGHPVCAFKSEGGYKDHCQVLYIICYTEAMWGIDYGK